MIDKTCNRCNLCSTRKNVVAGEGLKESGVIILGEAPGVEEDLTGRPFIGAAGRLLDKMLKQAGLSREQFYIENVVHCRPCDSIGAPNRAPTAKEIELCASHIESVIQEIKPKLIIPTGNIPLKYILHDRGVNISKKRGTFIWSDQYQCHIFPVYHPAAILRHFEYHATTVNDFKKVKSFLESRLPTSSKVDYHFISDETQLKTFFDEMMKAPEFAFDTETTGLDFITDKLLCITFSSCEKTAWCLPVLDSVTVTPYWKNVDVIKTLQDLFSNNAIKIAQNSKFDMLFLKKIGIDVNNLAFDTMLAHYLLDENAKEMHGLKSMAWEHTDMGGYERELEEYQKTNKLGKSMVGIPYNILSKYAMADADCTFRVYKVLKPMIEADGLSGLMTKLVMPLNYVLTDTEYTGVQIDINTLQQLQTKFSADIIRLKDLICTKAGRVLNLNSPKQLIQLLFVDLKLKPIKKTKKNSLATDKSVLQVLAKKHEIPKLLLEYRKCDKLYNTYMKDVAYDAMYRLHTNYSMSVTTTGRLTSSSPNLQNIPRDSEIKNMFIAKLGHVFIQLDFAQAEFRLWAQESKDMRMIQDIKNGKDIHTETAAVAFGIPIESVTKEQRIAAKNATFGMMYGRGSKSIAEQYNITEEKAKEIIDEFFKKYPVAARWIQHIVLVAQQQGYLRNFFGRKRRLVGLQSPNEEMQAMAKRQAKNFLMQSGAADLTNWLSVRLFTRLNTYATRLVLNVHDSLVYEVPEEQLNTVLDIIKTEANRPIKGFDVPMVVDIQVGKRWGDLTSPEKYQEELEDEHEI